VKKTFMEEFPNIEHIIGKKIDIHCAPAEDKT
jgi:hypothetical protein